MDETKGASLREIADYWTRLADDDAEAARPRPGAGQIESAARAGYISDELRRASIYIAYCAEDAGVDPTPLLTFVRRPNSDTLDAARTLIMRLSIKPGQPGVAGGTVRPCEADKPQTERLGLDAEQAAELLGISTSHFYAMQKDGRLGPEPRRLGDAVRWDKEELTAWWNAGCPPRRRWEHVRPAALAAIAKRRA